TAKTILVIDPSRTQMKAMGIKTTVTLTTAILLLSICRGHPGTFAPKIETVTLPDGLESLVKRAANEEVPKESPKQKRAVVSSLLALADSEAGKEIAKGIGQAAGAIVGEISKQVFGASGKGEAFVKNVEGSLKQDKVSGEGAKATANALNYKKAEIKIIPGKGYMDETGYAPPGVKIMTNFDSDNSDKRGQDSNPGDAYTYSHGIGPALVNGCFLRNYAPGDPCYAFKRMSTLCLNMLDAAAFIGVGFDGRGDVTQEFRKKSLVQRQCKNKGSFMNSDIPDTMNAVGIYDTDVNSRVFTSQDSFRHFLEESTSTSSYKGSFQEAINRNYGTSVHGGAGLGFFSASVYGGAKSSGSSSINSANSQDSSGGSSAGGSQRTGSSRVFMSYLEMNIVRFEIFMDEVTPGDLSQALLKDYLNLPTSYYKSSSAVMKYQNFLLRWGTHFIKSAKFGGSLKLSRTKVMSEKETEEQFATAAYSDMQSLLSNSFAAQSSSSQGSASFGIFSGARFQASRNTKEQENKNQAATKNTASSSASSANKQRTAQSYANSYLSVEGGDQEIASIISDMYDPGFKSKLEAWLQSIPEYPRPFSFNLGKITELFDMNVESLFPDDTNQGCLGGDVKKDSVTGKYYFESKKTVGKEIKTVKNYCKYGTSKKDFQDQFDKRRLALERAIAVYMEEGPIPATEQLIPAGRPGCDTSVTAFNKKSFSTWKSLISGSPFRVIFDMERNIPGIVYYNDIVQVSLKSKRWYTQRNENELHLYDGFDNGKSTSDFTLKRISVKGLLMTYDENNGMLTITNNDYTVMKAEGITILQKLVGRPIARVESLPKSKEDKSSKEDTTSLKVALPCNVKWSNVHSFRPTEEGSCVKFTAASSGDIFVVFALIPSNKDTWYTVQISTDSAGVYKANKVQQMETTIISAWGLGNSNLFQTYAVCLTKSKDTLHIQYGKVKGNEDKMTVYLDYKDTSSPILPEFYAFGSGMRDVQLVQISILPKSSMGRVECGNDAGTNPKVKDCFQCHPQCINGCFRRESDTACRACRTLTVYFVGDSKQCVEKCPEGSKQVEKVCKFPASGKTEEKTSTKPQVIGGCGGKEKRLLPDVPTFRLTASSVWNSVHSANRGRLDTPDLGEDRGRGCWMPDQHQHNTKQWIQADLGRVMKVTGVIIQGRNGEDYWVTLFRVLYSTDGLNFKHVMHGNPPGLDFKGNTDRNSKVRYVFKVPIEARYVRINPRSWYRYPAMRFDVTGCDK
ncbi:unnamed protein product, partial [Owenia fusiformis]